MPPIQKRNLPSLGSYNDPGARARHRWEAGGNQGMVHTRLHWVRVPCHPTMGNTSDQH